MGGMGRYLPYTTGLMWIGALALAGVPPFSGFFAKDQILADALARGDWVGYLVWGLGLVGAFVTALYTFRLMLLVFHGEPSEYAREHGEAHAGHGEGPFSMLWTIGILAVGATFAGFLEIPQVTHGMRNFLAPTVPSQLEATGNQDLGSSALAVGFALIGLVAAFTLWGRRSETTAAHRRCDRAARAGAAGEVRLRPALRLGLLPAGRRARPRRPAALGAARRDRQHGRRQRGRLLDEPPALERAVRPRARLRPRDRARHRGARRLARDGRLVSGSWTSTLLWLVPLGGALLVLVLPLRDATRGALALLASLATTVARARRRVRLRPLGRHAVRAVARLGARLRPDLPRRHGRPLARARRADGASACRARSASGCGRGDRTCAATRR